MYRIIDSFSGRIIIFKFTYSFVDPAWPKAKANQNGSDFIILFYYLLKIRSISKIRLRYMIFQYGLEQVLIHRI